MERLTKDQAAVIGAFTGTLCGRFADVQEYAERMLGRLIWTHEFSADAVANELKEAARPDFLSICHQIGDRVCDEVPERVERRSALQHGQAVGP